MSDMHEVGDMASEASRLGMDNLYRGLCSARGYPALDNANLRGVLDHKESIDLLLAASRMLTANDIVSSFLNSHEQEPVSSDCVVNKVKRTSGFAALSSDPIRSTSFY